MANDVLLCPFCKKDEAEINLEGIPICPKCLVVFGRKITNVKMIAKMAEMRSDISKMCKRIEEKMDKILEKIDAGD